MYIEESKNIFTDRRITFGDPWSCYLKLWGTDSHSHSMSKDPYTKDLKSNKKFSSLAYRLF